MEIPKDAVICAARHFVAAHESACTETPVDFAAVCVGCEAYLRCRARWTETALPVFKGAGVFPVFIRKD